MNYKRIFVSAIVATIVYFVVGGLVFAVTGPGEFSRYPSVFRTASDMQSHIPVGLIGTFLGILVITVIFARGCGGRRGVAEGAVFGMLVGVFAVCAFVLHNYVNLNIGLKLTIEEAGAFLFEWILVGIVIGVLYKPRSLQALPGAARS